MTDNSSMSRTAPRWTTLRIILAILAVGLITFGSAYLSRGYDYYQQFQAGLHDTPIQDSIDLSETGTFTFDFEQTCAISHGEHIALTVPDETLNESTPTQLVKGLIASVTITDRDDNEIVPHSTVDLPNGDQRIEGAIPWCASSPLRRATTRQPLP